MRDLTAPLLGHDRARTQVLDAWSSGRFHHAWLLSGPRGVGKSTFAERVAAFVLASPEPAPGLFGPEPFASLDLPADHPTLALLRAGGHPGLRWLRLEPDLKTGRPRTVITVDQVRALVPFFGSTTVDGGWRVVIVDAAEQMNVAAANALLKVLEEPPQRTLFLLVTHTLGRLLPTIRSRCRRLDLRPASDSDVVAALQAAGVAPERQGMLAAMAKGAIGTALRFAELDADQLEPELDALLAGTLDARRQQKLVAGLLGKTSRERLELFLERLLARLQQQVAQAAATQVRPGSLAVLEPTYELWDNARALAGQMIPLSYEPRLALTSLLDMAHTIAHGPTGRA